MFLDSDYVDHVAIKDDQSLQLFMRNTVDSLRWTYIALWTLDQNTQELACRDGWYNREMEAGTSSMTESVGLRLFNAYKLSRFALGIGVPSLALNGQAFIWLNLNELLSFSCSDNQREFYTVAGIQTVVFIPLGNGVIELGTTTLIPSNEQMNFQISGLLPVLFPPIVPLSIEPTRQTSSSSSLPSRSMDSPGCSSHNTDEQLNIPTPALSAFESFQPILPFLQPYATPYQAQTQLMRSPGVFLPRLGLPQPRSIQGQQPRASPMQPFPQLSSASASVANIAGAFRRWRSGSSGIAAVPPRMGGSQVRLKRAVEILKFIQAERFRQMAAVSATKPPGAPLSSSQVHHMISERRRREKLKESFDALRSLLPTGCRKDKASILANTREYLSTLKSRVQDLQQANQQLELSLKQQEHDHEQGAGKKPVEEGGEGGHQQPESMGTNVTIEEEQLTPESAQNNEFGLRITVENPSNSIDMIISLLNSLRQMEVDMISFTSQTQAATHLALSLRIRLPKETRRDPARVEQIKQGILRALGRPHI